MRLRPSGSLGCAVTLAALFAPAAAAGPDDGERLRRTPDGRPDPRGVRDFRSLTPFGRSEPLAGRGVFSAKEAARSTAERLAALDKDRHGPDVRIPPPGGCSDFWRDCSQQLTDDLRTLADDTASFEHPGSVAFPMRKNDLPVFEYACCEGNHGMLNLLVSSRAGAARKAAAEGRR